MKSSPENSPVPNSESIEELIDLLLEPRFGEDLSSESDSEQDLTALEKEKSLDFPQEDSHSDRVKVVIEGESEPTLEEAVEYEAFFKQIEPINSIEQVAGIETENASAEDLADAVNSLIPLVVDLLQFKLDDSREGVIQTVRPVLDRLIEERIQEDSPKMAAAIAKILPHAITEKINLEPLAIAKAIAPEIALCIREQILLDKVAIPKVLGPEMGKAIKAQIESEKDAMVDALYPVIGSTIAKYMVEVVQEINSKVERTLSPEGIKRKFQAKLQGVSEAELIFKESVGYRVRAIFLIDKNSGLIIQEIQLPGEEQLDSDMLAGMLTAIRSFANDCISSGSELDLIDYGDWQIPLEVAGYCYLAVVIAGEPPKQLIAKIRQVLSEIILEHDAEIQSFDGNLADVPTEIKTKLEQLLESEANHQRFKRYSPPSALIWLLIFIIGLVFVPWGIINYRGRVAHQIEQIAATQLYATPELSVYRLTPQVSRGKLTVEGRVPSEYLRDRANVIIQEIASQHQLQLDNKIITVDVPVNPTLITGEIKRLTNLFNQQAQVAIATNYQQKTYQPKTLTISGFILDKSTRQTIVEGFAQIPGIERVVTNVLDSLPLVKQRIYFNLGSSKLAFADNFSKIKAVEDLLQQYPQLHLKVMGHSDGIGSRTINKRLVRKRCQSVITALVARGIESNRLISDCNAPSTPRKTKSNLATWSKRYVEFEPFMPSNLPQ